MTAHSRKKGLGHPDRRVVIYAALFMVCALLSAAGLGEHALLAFLPAAVVTETLASSGKRLATDRDQREL